MLKKTTLLLLQFSLILISSSCLFDNFTLRPQPDESNPPEVPSDFDLFDQGISIGILMNSGKESLTNYREEFHFQITGQDEAGIAVDAFQDYLIEIDRAADTRREIQTIHTPSQYLTGTQEWVITEGFSYYVSDAYHGGRICEVSELSAGTSVFTNDYVTRILQTITPGELVESDVRVNGVLADVYAIKDLSLLFARTLNDISGRVWIARQPAYFIKAEGAIEGVFEFENRLYNGNATFTYEVKDFDQVDIQLPALCAYPPEEMIPVPPNATEVQSSPSLITFSSPDSADKMRAYYLNELASQGWTVSEVPSDTFTQVLQASITTRQGIQILIEVTIHTMSDGSYVQIAWQAQ